MPVMSTRFLYHVMKNISLWGVILSTVFERANSRLKRISEFPGASNAARS